MYDILLETVDASVSFDLNEFEFQFPMFKGKCAVTTTYRTNSPHIADGQINCYKEQGMYYLSGTIVGLHITSSQFPIMVGMRGITFRDCDISGISIEFAGKYVNFELCKIDDITIRESSLRESWQTTAPFRELFIENCDVNKLNTLSHTKSRMERTVIYIDKNVGLNTPSSSITNSSICTARDTSNYKASICCARVVNNTTFGCMDIVSSDGIYTDCKFRSCSIGVDLGNNPDGAVAYTRKAHRSNYNSGKPQSSTALITDKNKLYANTRFVNSELVICNLRSGIFSNCTLSKSIILAQIIPARPYSRLNVLVDVEDVAPIQYGGAKLLITIDKPFRKVSHTSITAYWILSIGSNYRQRSIMDIGCSNNTDLSIINDVMAHSMSIFEDNLCETSRVYKTDGGFVDSMRMYSETIVTVEAIFDEIYSVIRGGLTIISDIMESSNNAFACDIEDARNNLGALYPIYKFRKLCTKLK